MKIRAQDVCDTLVPAIEIEDEPLERAQLIESLLIDADGQEDYYLGEIARDRRLLRTLARMLAGLLVLLGLKVAWFFHCRADTGQSTQGQDRAELLARRAYLLSRVTAPHFGPQEFPAALGAQFQGEWALVSLSMTALALGGLAQQFPDAAGTTAADLDRIIDRTLTADVSAFDTRRRNEAALETLANHRGHVGYLGHLTLILAVREVSSPGSRHRSLLGQLAAALLRKLAHGPCGLAETYPGELYLPDNAVALALTARSAGLMRSIRARSAMTSTPICAPFSMSATVR